MYFFFFYGKNKGIKTLEQQHANKKHVAAEAQTGKAKKQRTDCMMTNCEEQKLLSRLLTKRGNEVMRHRCGAIRKINTDLDSRQKREQKPSSDVRCVASSVCCSDNVQSLRHWPLQLNKYQSCFCSDIPVSHGAPAMLVG